MWHISVLSQVALSLFVLRGIHCVFFGAERERAAEEGDMEPIVLKVAEASCSGLDLLEFAVEALAHDIDDSFCDFLVLGPFDPAKDIALKQLPGVEFVLRSGDTALNDAGRTPAHRESLVETSEALLIAYVPAAQALDPRGFVNVDGVTSGIREGGDVEE